LRELQRLIRHYNSSASQEGSSEQLIV
jgi:hypothetical protein